MKHDTLVSQALLPAAHPPAPRTSGPSLGRGALNPEIRSPLGAGPPQVGSIMNFALMYLLAKTPAAASSAARGGNLIQKLFDENTLKRLGAPGARS